MNIDKNVNGSAVHLGIVGRLDTATAPELEAAIAETCTAAQELVLDCSALEYISSAGLRVILNAHKLMAKQGTMLLTGVNEDVMEVFEITGFTDFLTFA